MISEVSYAPGERMAPHFHPHSSVTLVLAGEIVESVGGREEVAGPLSVVVKPAGVVHSDLFGPRGAHTLQIRIREKSEVEGAWMEGWRWHHARMGIREFIALAQVAKERRPVPASTVETQVWDVLGALAGVDDVREGGAPPPWLIRVREALDDQLPDPVEVRELAEYAGVHPISLTRAFKRHFGETVTQYRLRTRLRQAAGILARGSMSVSAVAHSSGFSDHSHFCREFRRATGVAPSDYCRLAGVERGRRLSTGSRGAASGEAGHAWPGHPPRV